MFNLLLAKLHLYMSFKSLVYKNRELRSMSIAIFYFFIMLWQCMDLVRIFQPFPLWIFSTSITILLMDSMLIMIDI
jgi:hypothetical protein